MSELEKKIITYGRERKLSELESTVQNADPKMLLKLISMKLGHPDAVQLLNYVFMGLSNSGPSIALRSKLIENTLETLDGKDISTSEVNAIISRVSCEIIKLQPSRIVRLSQWCVQSIQKSEHKHMIWKDLLPNLLNSLNAIDKVDHSGTEMSGSEYRRQVVNSLCMAKWNSDIITSLAGMFSDMEMSPDEHFQVMCKLCEGIEYLEPSSVPPLVHQLLLLSRHQHGLPLFLHLQQYFTKSLYNRIRSEAQESNSEDFISEELTLGSRQELLRAESTILFYINQSASLGHANVRDFLNSLKNTTTIPEMCLNPFFLTVLLSMSFVYCFEDQVFEIIKNAIARVLAEENLREHSAWLRGTTPGSCNLDKLITQLIESSGRERELVREGLVKLGFALLRSGRQKNSSGRQVWKLGRLILVRLVRKHYNVVSPVVKQLCDGIITGPNVHHQVDTLLKLSTGAPLLLSECQTVLKELVEQLLQLPGSITHQVVACLMPLARTFPNLRDCIMLVLRKAVFSCNLETRLMAVKGFLLLLKTLDAKSLAIATQSSQSTQTSLSQIHSELIDGGEAVGIEVVGILRRCVMQQVEVRLILYKGLFDAVCKSTSLYPAVLDFLMDLMKNYFISDEAAQPPLAFEKIINEKDLEVTLMEPLAHLVFVTQQLVTRYNASDDIESTLTLRSLQDILNQLCKRMSRCSLEHLDLREGVDMNDILPESRRMNEVYHQALGVYEALLVYLLESWAANSMDRHQEIISLFRTYSKLVEFGKNSAKSGRSSENKGSRGQKKKMNKSLNEKSVLKGRGRVSKKLPCVLDMRSAVTMMEALFADSVSWASNEDLLPLRNRRDFCKYALQATYQLLNQTQTAKNADVRLDSKLFQQCSEIGRILYQKFLHVDGDEEVSKDSDFDSQVFVLAVECFNELFGTVVTHFPSQLPQLLETIGGVEFSQGLGAQLLVIIKSVQKHLVVSLGEDYEDGDSDPILKKLPLYFSLLLTQLSQHLPHHCSQISEVFGWIKNFVKETTVYNIPVTKEILFLLFKLQISHKIDGTLLDNVALQLISLMGSLSDDKNLKNVPKFAILSEVTQIVCLQQLCGAIKHMIDDVEWMIQRLKGTFAARAYPSTLSQEEKFEQLKVQEREVCSHISHCVKLVTVLANITLPDGTADTVFKLLVSVYSTVSNLAKYFCNRSSKADMAFQAARFTSVIQLTAVELAKRVQWLLLHVMAESDDEEEKQSQRKVKEKSKKNIKMKLAKESKDSKLVPRIVYGMEMFEKNVILLAKKCNVNLMERVKVHSGRDFRIKIDLVQTALQQMDQGEEDENGEQPDEEVEELIGENDDEAEPPQPAQKKRRTS